MNYAFDEKRSTGACVVLRRTYALQIVLSVILYLLALPTLPVGLLLFLDPGIAPSLPFFWTGMGLLFLTAAFMVSTQIQMPRYIIFDNDRGTITVREKETDEDGTAYLPYEDIEGFQVREHRTTRTYEYVVEMNKRDGAFWTLFSTRSEGKAGAFCERLSGAVRLENTGRSLPKEGSAAPVEMITGAESTVIRWKKRFTVTRYLSGMLAIAAMAMAIFGAGPYVTSPIAYMAAKIFISVVIALAVYHSVNSIGKRYAVEITAGEFRYVVRGGLFRGPHFSMPIGEIDAILFNFSVASPEMVIYVFRKEEKEFFQRIKRGEIERADIFKAISVMRKVKRIDVGGLSITGKVYLEELLQTIIFQRTGRRGL